MVSHRAAIKHRLGRLALGCATFGREIDRAASFAVMDHAVAKGIVHFDTAPAYGSGASECMIGDWLASRQPAAGSLLIATKVKPPFRPAAIAASLAASRRRLGLNELAVVYLHQWSDELDEPGAIEDIAAMLPSQGAHSLGFSNFDRAQFERMLERLRSARLPAAAALQNNHNFAIRAFEPRLLDLAADVGTAVVSYSPLGAGFLTGKHRSGVSSGSRFEIVPGHQKLYFNPTSWDRLAQLEAAANRMNVAPALAALAWVLRESSIDCTLVGGRTPAHLDQAFAALNLASAHDFPLLRDE